MTPSKIYDIVIIGGGINGVGIARDAAGRGLSVFLAEKEDLAIGTSSRSSKMVHGGLRYLEYYEFRLVREALIEREILLKAAPHIIRPMRFILPHSPLDRPAWLIRLGLFLYDHLGGRKILPPSRGVNLRKDQAGESLKPEFHRGFVYSDCWVDDARLVVLNALDAAARGAVIKTRTEFFSARRENGLWRVNLRAKSGEKTEISARAIINAAGPWVENVLAAAGQNSTRKIRLVKGSHIITRKFWQGDHNYLLQNTDKRVIFVNQYQDDLAMIGTTDIPYGDHDQTPPPENVAISDDEIDYLLAAVNRYFTKNLQRSDIIGDYAGVRPLYDDNHSDNPSAVTRDYVFDVEDLDGALPILSIFGGKITTYRKLSEHALAKVFPYFPQMGKKWTAGHALPGGDLPHDMAGLVAILRRECDWLPEKLARHLLQLYGTRARMILGDAKDLAGLGRHFGHDFYEAEARYLLTHEWAVTDQDILFRRTKYGLCLSPSEQAEFAEWVAGFGGDSAS